MEKTLFQIESPKGWGTRHTFAVMTFFGMASGIMVRMCLSVAIVAMVKSESNETNTDLGNECPLGLEDPSESDAYEGEFAWNEEEQGLILGSYFWGNILGQIPGGYLSERFGGKRVFTFGMFGTSLATLFIPLASSYGVGAFIAVRIIQGLTQGFMVACMFCLIARWIPLHERSSLGSFISSGGFFGTFSAMALSGWLSSKLGWKSTFYFFGTFGVALSIAYFALCSDTPSNHPRISRVEREYIEHYSTASTSKGKSLPAPPLTEIFKSIPFYALLMAHVGNNWGVYTLLTETPTYLASIQHLSLQSNGLMSGLPYLLVILFSVATGRLTDFLANNKICGLTRPRLRKIMNTVGHVGPALALIGLAFNGCNETMAIVWLFLAVTLNGAILSGYALNHMDLSPNYAGTLMGITNTFANMGGFAAPYFTGYITNGNQTLKAWKTVFLVSAGVFIFDNFIFVIFGSSKTQEWNDVNRIRKNKQFHVKL